LLLALALLASGCGPLLSTRPVCERNPALVAAVDWSTATIEIRITRKGFEPHQVELRRNQPAILRVANADDRPRVFNAPKFFPTAAFASIALDERPIAAELCSDAIDIPPESILEISVVPLKSGRFPFGGPNIPIKSWGSGIAVMYVEGILIVK
jgi:hypothetical protein